MASFCRRRRVTRKSASNGASSSSPIDHGKRLGLSRRQFMQTGCGMAAAFLAMNEIYGSSVFQVDAAEAREPELTRARAQSLSGQFIFDAQTHFVRDDFEHKELLDLAKFAAQHWNTAAQGRHRFLLRYKFQNYVKEIYYDSDTNIALLSAARPSTIPWWLLSQRTDRARAREVVNDFAGSRRLLGAHRHYAEAAGLDGRGRQGDRDL